MAVLRSCIVRLVSAERLFPLNLLSAQPFDEAASAAHAALYEDTLEPIERYAPFACGRRRAGRHFCVGGSSLSLATPHDHTVVLYARFHPQQIRLLKRCQLQARTPNDALPVSSLPSALCRLDAMRDSESRLRNPLLCPFARQTTEAGVAGFC